MGPLILLPLPPQSNRSLSSVRREGAQLAVQVLVPIPMQWRSLARRFVATLSSHSSPHRRLCLAASTLSGSAAGTAGTEAVARAGCHRLKVVVGGADGTGGVRAVRKPPQKDPRRKTEHRRLKACRKVLRQLLDLRSAVRVFCSLIGWLSYQVGTLHRLWLERHGATASRSCR